MPDGSGGSERPAGNTVRAVALRYDDTLPAPFLVAKGAGAVADRMKSLAEECGIPILEDPAITGFLFPLEPGEMLPEVYWEIIARVYVYIAGLGGT
ncbi:MAG TPA: EscU/YscU/HrcU family type III secretion system export apparatus switch protein [Magnetospirillaceae bacterium]|nr:EscU/YscU/HrcU family type III secretion system export apparatus switch protein [Magnetospirillaceae bacterium]